MNDGISCICANPHREQLSSSGRPLEPSIALPPPARGRDLCRWHPLPYLRPCHRHHHRLTVSLVLRPRGRRPRCRASNKCVLSIVQPKQQLPLMGQEGFFLGNCDLLTLR